MEDACPVPLNGLVETDETFVGGKVRGKGYKRNKTAVGGAVERGGKIVFKVVQARDRQTPHNFINEVTADVTVAYFTEYWAPYDGIANQGASHETVNHSAEERVRGNVRTYSIENVWSLLKRSILGAYHHVSVKRLDACLDKLELEWRFNNRDNSWLFRDTLIRPLEVDHAEYKDLVA